VLRRFPGRTGRHPELAVGGQLFDPAAASDTLFITVRLFIRRNWRAIRPISFRRLGVAGYEHVEAMKPPG
jgi:hypothetical protein